MATVTFIRNKKQSAGALGGVKRYVEQEKKTLDPSGARLVSCQNCTPQFADKEFLATRMVYHKDSPVYFYHYTQSFSPDENITGQQAHDIAKEFAARAWPGSEVLIATHIDAAHIHSHFIVNAVCYESGKMLRQGPNTLKGLRQISDEICRAHGLTVLPPNPEQKSNGMSAREYRVAEKRNSWKYRLINAIDDCMTYAGSKEEFIKLMGEYRITPKDKCGIGVRWEDARKNITYTLPSGMRCRDDRLHEEKYLKENMEHEFAIRQETFQRGAESPEQARPSGCADAPQWSAPASAKNRESAHNADDRRGRGEDTKPNGESEQPRPVADGTGWENARELFYENRKHGESFEEIRAQLNAYRESLDRPDGADLPELDYLAGAVAVAAVTAVALEDNGPIRDATTTHYHVDSKALKETRRKKIAMGHKPDDHEDEQNWTMTM